MGDSVTVVWSFPLRSGTVKGAPEEGARDGLPNSASKAKSKGDRVGRSDACATVVTGVGTELCLEPSEIIAFNAEVGSVVYSKDGAKEGIPFGRAELASDDGLKVGSRWIKVVGD